MSSDTAVGPNAVHSADMYLTKPMLEQAHGHDSQSCSSLKFTFRNKGDTKKILLMLY